MNKPLSKKIGNTYITVGVIFCILAVILLAYPQLPHILNAVSINSPEKEEERISKPIYIEEQNEVIVEKPVLELPPRDFSLPDENYLIIPKVGVDSVIQTGSDADEELDEGPWLIPDYANPESRYLKETNRSIVIASHRFGYSSWSEEKRRRISFFSLPETQEGDRVKILWNQREYIYEIVEVGETAYVEDYDTDLILYTCKYYNTPTRIFRYANLVYINGEVPPTL